MSVAVPVIASVDGVLRKVYLKNGVRKYHPVDDIAAELQQLRSDDGDNHRWYTPLVIEQGGVFKGGTDYSGKFALFKDGARVVPANDVDHELDIIGEQIDGLGLKGISLVDKSSLTVSVNVNYLPPPTTEIKVVSTGSVVTAQDKIDIANQSAAAVWSITTASLNVVGTVGHFVSTRLLTLLNFLGYK